MFMRKILLVAIVCMLILACSIPGNPGDAEQSDQNIESPSNEQGGEASPSQPSGPSANPGEIHDEEDSDVPEPNITAEYIENYSSYVSVVDPTMNYSGLDGLVVDMWWFSWVYPYYACEDVYGELGGQPSAFGDNGELIFELAPGTVCTWYDDGRTIETIFSGYKIKDSPMNVTLWGNSVYTVEGVPSGEVVRMDVTVKNYDAVYTVYTDNLTSYEQHLDDKEVSSLAGTIRINGTLYNVNIPIV